MLLSIVGSVSKAAKKNHVVFIAQQGKDKIKSVPHLKEVEALIKKYHASGELSAELGSVLFLRGVNIGDTENLLLVGAGDHKKLNGESLRRAGAFAYRCLRKEKQKAANFCEKSLQLFPLKIQEAAALLSESIELTNYKYTQFLSNPKQQEIACELLADKATDRKNMQKAADEGLAIAEAMNFARRVSDAPSNFMTPEQLAKETLQAAKTTKLKVQVWDKARIKKEKLGSLLGVAQGSAQDPRVIILEYQGAAKSKKPVCFVGKGLTFDTGGISIKPSAGMEAMKYDMCGGANVIGAMLAIAKLGLKVNVIAYVGAVENMPDGTAIKPGDILRARSGKTIEVTNTDAEGRLVLADLLCLACERQPASIFTMATLTGAIIVALGNLHTGLFTKDDKLCKKIQEAAEEVGEDVWRMPLLDAHQQQMKSDYADIGNMGTPARAAGSAQAAGFLQAFVGEGIPFAHFDIASQMSDMGSYYPYHPDKGACAAMLRTFVEYARNS